MCCVNPDQDDAPSPDSNGTTAKPCVFCGEVKASGMEIDIELWAVCCGRCGTIGPHARNLEQAVARWNSTNARPAVWAESQASDNCCS